MNNPIICPACGATYPAVARFCGKCGRQLPGSVSRPAAFSKPNSTTTYSPKTSDFSIVKAIAALLAVTLLVGMIHLVRHALNSQHEQMERDLTQQRLKLEQQRLMEETRNRAVEQQSRREEAVNRHFDEMRRMHEETSRQMSEQMRRALQPPPSFAPPGGFPSFPDHRSISPPSINFPIIPHQRFGQPPMGIPVMPRPPMPPGFH